MDKKLINIDKLRVFWNGIKDYIKLKLDKLKEETEDLVNSINIELIDSESGLSYLLKVGNTTLGNIDIPKDLFVKSVTLNKNNIEFTFETLEGELVIPVNLSKFVDVYTAGRGLALDESKFSVKIDPASSSLLSLTDNGLGVNVDNIGGKPVIDPLYSDPSFNWDTMKGNYLSKLKESFNKVKTDNIGTILFVQNPLDRNDYDSRTGGAIPVGADVNKWLLNKDELLYLSGGDIIILAKNTLLNAVNIRGFILRTRSTRTYLTEDGSVEGTDGVMTAWDKYLVNDLPAFKQHVNNNLLLLWSEVELPDDVNAALIWKEGIYRINSMHAFIDNDLRNLNLSVEADCLGTLKVFRSVDYDNGYSDVLLVLNYNSSSSSNNQYYQFVYFRILSRRRSDGYINPGSWHDDLNSIFGKSPFLKDYHFGNFDVVLDGTIIRLGDADGNRGAFVADDTFVSHICSDSLDIVDFSNNFGCSLYPYGLFRYNLDTGEWHSAIFSNEYMSSDTIDSIFNNPSDNFPTETALAISEEKLERRDKIKAMVEKMKEGNLFKNNKV